jgi:hypothetical protein
MVRVSTGIRDIDDFIAARGETPPEATNVDDIDPDTRVATVSRKTRNLERLAELPALRRLVARATNDKTLRLIGGATAVEDLELCGGTMGDLSPLSGLQKLRLLAISVASRLRSLEGIEAITPLQYLSAWHCAGLTSVAPLAGLRGLRYVFLDGTMYKPMRLDSLAAFAGLHDLEVLKLHNVRVRDRDLQPLHSLRKLTQLDLPDHFPVAQFAALAAAVPAANGRWRSRFEARSADGARSTVDG